MSRPSLPSNAPARAPARVVLGLLAAMSALVQAATAQADSPVPVVFVENRGQCDDAVRFVARCAGLQAGFGADGFRLTPVQDVRVSGLVGGAGELRLSFEL